MWRVNPTVSEDVTEIVDVLPSIEAYDPETASDEIKAVVALHDFRELGLLANGEPRNGEETWYLTETGQAWTEGKIELDLKELAESEDVSESDLYCSFEHLKRVEKFVQLEDFASEDGGENL